MKAAVLKNVCNHLKLLGVEYDGGFADYAVAGADKVYRIPDSVSMNELDKAFQLLEEKPDQYLKILVKHQ